jgi:hypothetical protein
MEKLIMRNRVMLKLMYHLEIMPECRSYVLSIIKLISIGPTSEAKCGDNHAN